MFADDKNVLIGQEELLTNLNKYTIDTFPHSILLEGESGCGKHTLCRIIADKFNIDLVNLNSTSDKDDFDEIQFRPYPCLYVIDLTSTLMKYQNSILKLLEEPPQNAFIICLCLSTKKVLPTILNRCIVWSFAKYTVETLSAFTYGYADNEKEIALSIFDTPGKILWGVDKKLAKISLLVSDIINRIGRASIPNVLSIADKIAFNNEKDKYELDVFIELLLHQLFERIKCGDTVLWLEAYKNVVAMKEQINNCISKQRTFDGCLISLYEVLHANN